MPVCVMACSFLVLCSSFSTRRLFLGGWMRERRPAELVAAAMWAAVASATAGVGVCWRVFIRDTAQAAAARGLQVGGPPPQT